MRRVTTFTSLTLDGVMQAPGRPDEDTRGGFKHGGWAQPYADKVLAEVSAKGMGKGGAMLFGRRTYEDFAKVWPKMPQPNPFTEALNKSQKYVASTALKEPLPWENSTLLSGDAGDAVAKLKKEKGEDLVVLGSGVLIQSLMERDLIDEYVLLIHPLVLGSGHRLFIDASPFASLKLVESMTTTKGVVVATYQPAPPPATAKR